MIAAVYLVALLVAAYGYSQFLKLLSWALKDSVSDQKVRVVVRMQDWRTK